eukprot:14090747-Heterocapsa_arctica.AAC.1
MLSHLRRLTNAKRYAEACANMEVTAVRVLDRLLEKLVSREESQLVPGESPPMTSPEEDCASRPRHPAPRTPSPRRRPAPHTPMSGNRSCSTPGTAELLKLCDRV